MTCDEFRSLNVSDGNKGQFLDAFNDPRTTTKMAYFEADGVCYAAKQTKSPYDPVFKLCGAGYKNVTIIANYDPTQSLSADGAKLLHNFTFETFKPSFTDRQNTKKIPSKTFKLVEIKVADRLKGMYPVMEKYSPIVSDIQSESASVKNDQGQYLTCGMRTVHRLYLATAFTILRKLHQANSRDGVVAIIVGKDGRILSWGRKNNAVPCWHGETSAIMALGGKIPEGSCVFSTLKPCNMCAGLIKDASSGKVKVFWGQDDPGRMAESTCLETSRLGSLLDGNKSHNGARAILLGDKNSQRTTMAKTLDDKFKRQKRTGEPSTIDYIVTDEAATIIRQAERALKAKYDKYKAGPENFNENTAFVVRYLTDFLAFLGCSPDSLGN